MGVSIYLDIDAGAIEAPTWRDFYAEAQNFMMRHPAGLVGLRRETIECDGHAIRRWVYSTQLEQDEQEPSQRHLRVCGDQSSLKTAESFSLSEDIAHYRWPGPHEASVSFIAEALDGEICGNVFSEKTQGYPYHQAVLAVGMLAEARFPGHALVRGDISLAQCQAAASLMEEIAGITLPLPLIVDGDRLYDVLVGQAPTVERLERLVIACPLEEAGLVILYHRAPRHLLLDWLASQIANYEGRITLGVTSVLQHWLNVTEDLDGLIGALSADAGGFRLEPNQIAEAVVSTGVTLEPRRAAGLAGLDQPDAAPDSVYSQFGNAMLDFSGLGARNCRYRLGLEPVIARLTKRFPTQQEAIQETLEQQTRRLQERLERLGAWAASVRDKADRDPEDGDGKSFLHHSADDELSANQDELLRGLGAEIASLWDEFRAGLAELLGDGVAKRHIMLMQVLEHQQIALTEQAWGWIDAERDKTSLDLLILIAVDTDSTQLFTNLQRGLLEHRSLCFILLQCIQGRPSPASSMT